MEFYIKFIILNNKFWTVVEFYYYTLSIQQGIVIFDNFIKTALKIVTILMRKDKEGYVNFCIKSEKTSFTLI